MVGADTDNSGITKEEHELIFILKQNVKDILPENIRKKSEFDQNLYFVRWIRARENQIDKATEMLRKHLEWREERNADNALDFNIHPFFLENFAYTLSGVDKKGLPVVCLPLSDWDIRKVVSDSERLAEFDNFVTNLFEMFINRIETENARRPEGHPPITQLTALVDAKNYPYGQLLRISAIKKLLSIAGVYEAHYPEILNSCHFINCPSYFGMFMSLLKPFVAPKTMGKLTCHSSMTKWQAEISEIVDPSLIPERYGGYLKM